MPPEGFVSLREIAEKIGVSISAVSLALRNSPKISLARRRDIQRQAEAMGYCQDPRVTELMEHLRKSRGPMGASRIAVLVPDLTPKDLDNFSPMPALITGVRSMADTVGFGVDVIHLSNLNGSCRQARSVLRARGIKGLVVAPFTSGVVKLDFDFEGFSAATAGYSIMEPGLHRACPDYLTMMDEMLAMCVAAGYRRIGLVMTYNEGGIGYKLFTSSFLFFESEITPADRIPMLANPLPDPVHEKEIDPARLKAWMKRHRPDVIIGAAPVYEVLSKIGVRVPDDIGFVSIDVSEPPHQAAGADHCYEMVGAEAFKLMHSALNLNLTGLPEHPRVVLVDSHQQDGFSIDAQHRRPAAPRRKSPPTTSGRKSSFRGFLH